MAAPLDPSRPDRAAGEGAGGGWRAHLALAIPDLAWEFLRRNRDYRADWRRSRRCPEAIAPQWGLQFAADPALAADRAGVLWRPEIAPGLVVPFDGDPSAAGEWRSGALLRAARRTADGLHLRFESGLQLQFCGAARAGQPLLVVLLFDRDLGLRIDAVERLNRTLSGRPSAPSHWTKGQRERLAKSLTALDGALMGETYRQIAARLFGRHAGADEPWPTSSIRATTIRLVQSGKRLMGGGYRQLLRKGL